jgi:hypothetical protein
MSYDDGDYEPHYDKEDYDGEDYEECGVIGSKADMAIKFASGTFFSRDEENEDSTSSEDEEDKKRDAVFKADLEARHRGHRALRDKASARIGEEVSCFSAHLREKHDAAYGREFPFLLGTIYDFHVETHGAEVPITHFQVKLKQMQFTANSWTAVNLSTTTSGCRSKKTNLPPRQNTWASRIPTPTLTKIPLRAKNRRWTRQERGLAWIASN